MGSPIVLQNPASSGISKSRGSTPNAPEAIFSAPCCIPGMKLRGAVNNPAAPEVKSLPVSLQSTGSGGSITCCPGRGVSVPLTIGVSADFKFLLDCNTA